MCKGFSSTLTRTALQWYITLPTGLVDSFAALTKHFVEQFASKMNLEKTANNLYEILQHQDKSLHRYIAYFNQE